MASQAEGIGARSRGCKSVRCDDARSTGGTGVVGRVAKLSGGVTRAGSFSARSPSSSQDQSWALTDREGKIGPAALENERGGAGFAGIPFRQSLLNLVAFSVFGATHGHPGPPPQLISEDIKEDLGSVSLHASVRPVVLRVSSRSPVSSLKSPASSCPAIGPVPGTSRRHRFCLPVACRTSIAESVSLRRCRPYRGAHRDRSWPSRPHRPVAWSGCR